MPPVRCAYPRTRRMAGLVVATCVLLVPWTAAPHPSVAVASGQIPGGRLSVSAAQVSYPRGALVRVTVQLRNVSRGPIQVGSSEAVECAKVGPSAVVLSEQGTQVYPPAPLGGLQGSCGPNGLDDPKSLRPLLPGQTMTRHPYVILGGPTIRAIVTYYVQVRGEYVTLHATSKPLSVSLYDAPKPALMLVTSPSLSATITPETGVPAATLRTVYQWLCPGDGNAFGTAPMPSWKPVRPDSAGRYTLTPGCPQPYQWHVGAGFPNEPVVYIDYCRPSEFGCEEGEQRHSQVVVSG